MRFFFIILISVFAMAMTGCETLETATSESALQKETRIGLSPRNLAPGDCGLFVWKADQAKTFILYTDQDSAALYRNGAEEALSLGLTLGSTERTYVDSNGQSLSLSLFEPQDTEQGTRYKSGRLESKDQNGWDVVTPVVGLYSCQPVSL